MVDCPYFKTDYLHLTENWLQDLSDRDAFTILMCVNGDAQIANETGTVNVKRGETVLVPAISNSISIKTDSAEFLEVTIWQ